MAYEEFDISFEKIVAGNVTEKHSGIIQDANDKASWTALLDYIKRKQNIIFVMVTNKTYDEIQKITNGDESFLRYGRIDAHFVWPEEDDDIVRKINTKPPNNENKHLMQIEDSARSDSSKTHTTNSPKNKWWDTQIKNMCVKYKKTKKNLMNLQ